MSADEPGAVTAAPAGGARHPLALRERAWLAAQLRTVRGRTLRPGDQVAIDTAAIVTAGVVLDEGGRVVEGPGVGAGSAESLRTAVAAIERQWRASRREAVTPGAPGWAIEAARRDEQTVRLLRRVRNAAVRAERGAGRRDREVAIARYARAVIADALLRTAFTIVFAIALMWLLLSRSEGRTSATRQTARFVVPFAVAVLAVNVIIELL